MGTKMVVKLKDVKPLWVASLVRKRFWNKLYPSYNWEGLKSKLRAEGYSPNKYGFIEISSGGYVRNGNHRVILLRELHGNEFKIEVELYEPTKKKKGLAKTLAVIGAGVIIFILVKWWWLLPIVVVAGCIMEYKNHKKVQ